MGAHDYTGWIKNNCALLNSQTANSVHSTVSNGVLMLSLRNWHSNLKIWQRSVEKWGSYTSLGMTSHFFLCPMGCAQLLVELPRPIFGLNRNKSYYLDFIVLYWSLKCIDHISVGCLNSTFGQQKIWPHLTFPIF